MIRNCWGPLALVLCTMFFDHDASADEGMYLFNDVPRQTLQSRYQFDPTDDWLDHLRLSSVRFNVGGSGSFVSRDGLVLTNHHVASDTLAKLSTADRNLIDNGFLAKTPGEELQAPDLELNQLVSIEVVTDRVNAAVGDEADADVAAKKRRAVIANIEKESLDQTGFRSDVVKLFGGAEFHLYRYRRYTDVRLVWAPEVAAAFFGGDADNFEYPRYNLDATLFRVYEDGKPAVIEHHLKWSDQGVREGELVFVSGNPGRTQRIFTVAALQYLRDDRLPFVLDTLRRREILLQQFSLGGPEAKRRARDELFGVQNARKAYGGMLSGLQDPATIATKRAAEEKLSNDADAKRAIDEIAAIADQRRRLLKQSVSLRSDVFDTALRMWLLSIEDKKPNADRLRPYSDSNRESLLRSLLSPAPLYADLERVKLADELSHLMELRGGDDEFVQSVLDGRSPQQIASGVIAGTKLMDASERKAILDRLMAGESVDDPMIALVERFEAEYRRLRGLNEALEERETAAYQTITAASAPPVDAQGDRPYPDATFTLRLAFGTVAGYVENGDWVAPTTDYAGAFSHAAEHAGQEDFDLPASWNDAKDRLDLSTQLNFVCTADIIGGNSGSPVVNRKGELVGLIFDGNIQSLVSDYVYRSDQARAVSVSAVAIPEAIRAIYGAEELAGALGR